MFNAASFQSFVGCGKREKMCSQTFISNSNHKASTLTTILVKMFRITLWSAFLESFCFLQRIIPSQVVYNKDMGKFEKCNKARFLHWFRVSQVLLIFFLSTQRLVQRPASTSVTINFLFDFMFHLLLWGYALEILACSWTFWRKREEVIYFLNQLLITRESKRLKQVEIQPGNPSQSPRCKLLI